MNGEKSTGNVSTTGTIVTGGGGTDGGVLTVVTGGSGGTDRGVVTVARKQTSRMEARHSDAESAKIALARAEIRSGQKMSDQDYKSLTVEATKKKIFRLQKFVYKGTTNEARVKEVLRVLIGVASKDGFELVIWPMIEETMRETLRTRRQSVFSAMRKKLLVRTVCPVDVWVG